MSETPLADNERKSGRDKLIIVSAHEKKQGIRKLESLCACAYEAVLGAYYIEGKYDEVKSYIEKTFEPYIEDVKDHFERYNAKETLQEYTQSKTKTRPVYKILSETGPAHKKVFEVEVSYEGKILAVEKGMSKKDAEQKAAYKACEKLGIIDLQS